MGLLVGLLSPMTLQHQDLADGGQQRLLQQESRAVGVHHHSPLVGSPANLDTIGQHYFLRSNLHVLLMLMLYPRFLPHFQA
jgi:hypothetical protein